MIRNKIAQLFGLPLQDYFRRTNIIGTLKLLRESQYWDEEKIRDYQLVKLKLLIKHAYNNVPYYEELFNRIKLKPSDISSLDDLYKIPILTKEIVRKENMRIVSKNFNMKYVKKGKTGGTTGAPIVIYKDTNNRSFTWASYYRWYEWMGLECGDRTTTFWGARTILSRSIKSYFIDHIYNYFQNNLRIDSFHMSNKDLPKIYRKVKDFNPVFIKGYLSALLKFANYIDSKSLPGISPKVLSSTTETVLPHHRIYLQKIFSAPIFDQYGCGELSAIAYECAHHNGLHINQEHIICEILDKSDELVFETPGRVIGTDLDNYVMPFIRYETGDLATLSSKNCKCGVNQPLISSVDGRTIDTITLKDGNDVHGVFFTDILYELGVLSDKITRFQIIQTKPGFVDIWLETPKQIDITIINKLIDALSKYFIDIDVKLATHLESDDSGKFRYIINRYRS